MLNKVKIICITETHLSAAYVKEAEIAMPNFKLIRKDNKNNTKSWGIAIYLHTTLKLPKLDWLEKTESLPLKITDSNSEVFVMICIYRCLNLSKKDYYKLIEQLNLVVFYVR